MPTVFRAGRIVAAQPTPPAVTPAATNGRLPAVTAIAEPESRGGKQHERVELGMRDGVERWCDRVDVLCPAPDDLA